MAEELGHKHQPENLNSHVKKTHKKKYFFL